MKKRNKAKVDFVHRVIGEENVLLANREVKWKAGPFVAYLILDLDFAIRQ